MAISRRRILQLSGGAAVLACAGAFRVWNYGYAPAGITLRTLSTKEYRILSAVAATLLGHEMRDFPDAAHIDVAARLDRILLELDDDNFSELRQLLHFLEHGLPLRHGYFSRFTQLPSEARHTILNSMRESSIGLLRGAFVALKSLIAMGYFSDARTWPAIGYDGPRVRADSELATLRMRRLPT